MAEQLRPASSQHGSAEPTPTRSALPRDHSLDHRQADRLAGPLEPRFTAYPLGPLADLGCDEVSKLAGGLMAGRGQRVNCGKPCVRSGLTIGQILASGREFLGVNTTNITKRIGVILWPVAPASLRHRAVGRSHKFGSPWGSGRWLTSRSRTKTGLHDPSPRRGQDQKM